MTRINSDSTYRPEIDGLRGIAILAVLLNHTDSSLLSGGYVGVDVFFVISGFLITTIVRRNLDAGHFSFWHFYARRAKRLIPAATAMATATLVLGHLFLLPQDYLNLGRSLLAYGAMLSNVFFWRQTGDYWTSQSSHWPLLHTWSLSVEEQFYLVYPLILWGLAGLSRRRQLQAISALLAASFVVGLYQTSACSKAAYYLLPSRAWELLAGAACSLFGSAPQSRITCGLLGLVAAGLVGVPMLLFNEATQFPGWCAASPVTGTAILLWITREVPTIWTTLLGWKPLVAIGRVSYSLYLFHWPAIVFAKYLWAGSPESPSLLPSYLAATASFPIAWLSYRCIETPWRGSRVGDKPALAIAFACGLLLLFAGYAIRSSQGWASRLPSIAAIYAQASLDPNRRLAETGTDKSGIESGDIACIGGPGPIDFVLLGDSHATVLVPVFDRLGKECGIAGTAFTSPGTLPLTDIEYSGKFFDPDLVPSSLERLAKDRIPYVVLAARWDGYLDKLLECGRPVASRARQMDLLCDSLSRTIAALRESGVKKIWLVRQVPTQNCHVPKTLALHAWWGRYLPLPNPRPVSPEDCEKEMQDIDTLFHSFIAEDVKVIDLAAAVVANKDGLLTECGSPMYYDNNHLSARGALSLRLVFQPIFEQITKANREAEPADSTAN